MPQPKIYGPRFIEAHTFFTLFNFKLQDEMMNNNGNGVKPIKDSRSKSQLLQDLSKTQDRLDKKEIELARCKQELHGTQTELTASNDLKANLQAKEHELGKALNKTQNLESKLIELRKKVESLERQNKDLKQQTNSKNQKTHSGITEKQQLAENRIEDLEAKEKHLTQRIKALESQNKNLQPENARLRRELYRYTDVKGEPVQAAKQDTLVAEPVPEAPIPFDPVSSDDPQTTKRVSRQRHVEQQHISQALQEIRFRQQNENLEPGQPLRPWEPFAICVQLNLHSTPDRDKLETDSTNYSIQIAARENDSKEVVVVDSVVGELNCSQSTYEDVIEMPKFSPGKYELEVVAIAPAVRIGEQKKMEFVVKY